VKTLKEAMDEMLGEEMQVAKNGPSEKELYEIYVREGLDDVLPFDRGGAGDPDGRTIALEKWWEENGQFGVGA